MATIFRPPLITRIERQNPSAAAQTPAQGGSNLVLLTAVVVVQPTFPPLWPNPTPVRWPVDLRTWFNFQTTPITIPVAGFDFVNTRSYVRPQEPTLVPNVTLLAQPAATLPPGVLAGLDQPNPMRPDRFGVYRHPQFPNFTVLPQPNTQPFLNVDWPVPRGPQYSVVLRSFSDDVYIANRLPPPGVAETMNTLSISILASQRLGF